jgi:cell division protein ZapA (FtsZ GTPase activity inhibitor)
MRTFDVKILGQRYKVKSEDGDDYIQQLADFVNDNISEVQKNSKTVSTHSVVILAALNIADKLLKLQEEHGKLHKEVRDQIRHIMTIIRSRRETVRSQ